VEKMIPYNYVLKEMVEKGKKVMKLEDGTIIRLLEGDFVGETTTDDRCWD